MPPPGPSPHRGVSGGSAAPRTPNGFEEFWCAPRTAAQRPSAETMDGGGQRQDPDARRGFSPQGGGAAPPSAGHPRAEGASCPLVQIARRAP